ncbi:MAG TPA: zinc ribbon domain-containing protein [Candidatus Paceibacterota bacterium]|jgi:hypothetical protein|nr:zinc ribbon domain-containing protein [Candidatus Paceibacterota bacterium]
MDKPTGASKTHQSILSWKIPPAELAYQVEEYETLGISESYRGVAVLLVFLLLGISLAISLLGVIDFTGVIIEGVVYLVLCFFVYKGHRWAIIGLMALWTLDKGFQLTETPGIMPIVWWVLFMPYFYKALKVENERNKKHDVPPAHQGGTFCVHCGNKQEHDAKFCTECGKQIT